MNSFVEAIRFGFLFFPIVALCMTLPYIVYQYHKYGSVISLRIPIIYSFVLYMLIAYYLVILPLPSIESVKELTRIPYNFIPFQFVTDFLEQTHFSLHSLKSMLDVFQEPCFYLVFYNILLTLPFGFYLKYYFKCSMKETIIATFILSLFFELTQLSGLYFIYPRAYRIFDIDDLILNTFGGFLGYFLGSFVNHILPTRDDLDMQSYKRGQSISIVRRSLAFLFDIGIVVLCIFFFSTFFSIKIVFPVVFIGYLFITPIVLNGATIMKHVFKIKVVKNDGTKANAWQLLAREILFYGVFFGIPICLYSAFISDFYHRSFTYFYMTFLVILLFSIVVFYVWTIKRFLFKERMFYELLSQTKEISTIEIPQKE